MCVFANIKTPAAIAGAGRTVCTCPIEKPSIPTATAPPRRDGRGIGSGKGSLICRINLFSRKMEQGRIVQAGCFADNRL